MSIACSHSGVWIRKTLRCWVLTSCRPVSTTSAINRGLRATKEADGGRGRRRDRSLQLRKDDGGKGSPAFRSRSLVSNGEPKVDAKIEIARNRTGRRDGEGAERRINDIQEDRPKFKLKKYTSEGERPGSANLWTTGKVHHVPSDVNEIQTRGSSSYPFESKSWKPLPGKKHPELYSVIGQLEPLLREFKGAATSRYSSAPTKPKRPRKAENDKLILELLETVNENMSSGTWTKRYVRDALNDRQHKLHSWTPDPQELWFDYENSRLELVSEENAKELRRKWESKLQGQGSTESRSIEPVDAVESPSAKAGSNAKRLFTIDSPDDKLPSKQGKYANTDDTPLSVSYTTAASTFLYGTNTVLAALSAKRRKLYKLYVHVRTRSRGEDYKKIMNLAKKANIPIQHETKLQLLDRLSEFRPHNGLVLEASKLPVPPVLSLGQPDPVSGTIPLSLSYQSAEDIAVNGTPDIIPSLAYKNRKPFIVMLDGITDPGNVGSILRTCHFYGVDAVAVATNTCANINSATLAKASSGACEAIPILALPKPSDFAYQCAKAGWRLFAAVAPGFTPSLETPGPSPKKQPERFLSIAQLVTNAPLMKDPCILMLGAEGEGLRANLMNRADYFVSIVGCRPTDEHVDVWVDSLNVSAAASVLLESFMRRPEGVKAAIWRMMKEADRSDRRKTEGNESENQRGRPKDMGKETTRTGIDTVE